MRTLRGAAWNLGDRSQFAGREPFLTRVDTGWFRLGQPKRTAPSTQEAHWFSHAILAAMQLRVVQLSWQSVMAFPAVLRYRRLYATTAAPLAAATIEASLVNHG